MDRSMQKGRIEFTDDNFSEVNVKIFPGHIEGTIFRIAIIVVLISQFFGPKWGLK
jgi:hypothetical protein